MPLYMSAAPVMISVTIASAIVWVNPKASVASPHAPPLTAIARP
jgi:hypothetical protein